MLIWGISILLIFRYGSLPIILDGILTNLLDPDETLKNMTEMIKQEAENNIQVFEILETNSSDRFSKNNKIAALLNKSNNKVNITYHTLSLT